MHQMFEYGGFHFIPERQFNKEIKQNIKENLL
nr:MAG TPA: hypothetical protein [Caudoviricetes sp.]